MKEKIISIWTAITLALVIAVLSLLGHFVARMFAAAIVITLMPLGAIFLWSSVSNWMKEKLKGGAKK